MRLSWDYEDDRGHKIRKESNGRGGGKDIDMTAMFERPGRRTTSNVDILVYEGVADRSDVKNVARPATVEAARKARRRIERARREGLSPAEAIGATDDDGADAESFSDALERRSDDGQHVEDVMEVGTDE